MEPLLEEEKKRGVFDIHAYGERLLANFDSAERDAPRGKKSKGEDGGETPSRPFAELANCTNQYEVCRMFLATLDLTNRGNVELSASGSLDGGDQSLTVNLLSRHRKVISISED